MMTDFPNSDRNNSRDISRDSARAERRHGRITEVAVTREGRSLLMLGATGADREYAFLPAENEAPFAVPSASSAVSLENDPSGTLPAKSAFACQSALPVLIGSGAGYGLAEVARRLLERYGPSFRLAVVDKETDILEATNLRQEYASCPGVVWLEDAEEAGVLKALTDWQAAGGGLPLLALTHPFYLRLDRDFYAAIRSACEASTRAGFWQQTRYAKFTGTVPRILLLTSSYFLMGEVIAACERLGYEHRFIEIPEGELAQGEFVEKLLTAVVDFKPDFAFTINHLGVDREGVLTSLLERLRLPLASWFVDNPHLILSMYSGLVSPWVTLFTWDADNLDSLPALGFEHVFYLPLGTDIHRFIRKPPASAQQARALFPLTPFGWNGDISFVGNSMVSKIASRRDRSKLPPELLKNYSAVATGFAEGEERSIRGYLEAAHPHLLVHFDALGSVSDRLGYETMLTWEATLQYRFNCVQAILPLAPLLVGDKGWNELVSKRNHWFYHPEMSYYTDLPLFYPCSAINFNCTSKQMKGAVNQRVFDVPATGAFLLTDYREQVENLFEPGCEIICFHSPDEAADLARRYLGSPKERDLVAEAAQKRIAAEHTYDHRIRTLTEKMRSVYE